MMLKKLAALFFPPKCVLCRDLLQKSEKGLCSRCISQVSTVSKGKFKVSFVARWTSLWYYKDDVRKSILRYKFYGQRSYGPVYAALLAEKLRQEDMRREEVGGGAVEPDGADARGVEGLRGVLAHDAAVRRH